MVYAFIFFTIKAAKSLPPMLADVLAQQLEIAFLGRVHLIKLLYFGSIPSCFCALAALSSVNLSCGCSLIQAAL